MFQAAIPLVKSKIKGWSHSRKESKITIDQASLHLDGIFGNWCTLKIPYLGNPRKFYSSLAWPSSVEFKILGVATGIPGQSHKSARIRNHCDDG